MIKIGESDLFVTSQTRPIVAKRLFQLNNRFRHHSIEFL